MVPPDGAVDSLRLERSFHLVSLWSFKGVPPWGLTGAKFFGNFRHPLSGFFQDSNHRKDRKLKISLWKLSSQPPPFLSSFDVLAFPSQSKASKGLIPSNPYRIQGALYVSSVSRQISRAP